MTQKIFYNIVCPPVNTKYGAPMGRCNVNKIKKEGTEYHIKTSKRRIYLDSGGYDYGGAYWGHGKPLFAEYTKDGLFIEYFRE